MLTTVQIIEKKEKHVSIICFTNNGILLISNDVVNTYMKFKFHGLNAMALLFFS